MAELATPGGGVITVNPRDVDALEAAMHRLLTEPDVLARLQDEAARRHLDTWDDYARTVWNHLVVQ
jgi:hypothetical protein